MDADGSDGKVIKHAESEKKTVVKESFLVESREQVQAS